MRPFHCQTRGQVSDCCFRCIVRSLWLRHVDNRTGHASYHDDASWRLSLHQMFRHASCEEICAIHIYTPQLLHPFIRIGNGIVVLDETCRGDQMIDLAMFFDDLGQCAGDRIRIRHITVVCRDFRGSKHAGIFAIGNVRTVVSFRFSVLLFEVGHQLLGLVCCLVICRQVNDVSDSSCTVVVTHYSDQREPGQLHLPPMLGP